jgi:hypothetical protein
MDKYTCPCCGYKTLSDEPGHYEICPVCFWEDDWSQKEYPDDEGGPNRVSLRTGQQNFIDFGACELDMKRYTRKPSQDEPKDLNWRQNK